MRTIKLTASERTAYSLRTASGREVHDGDTISADDPLVVPASDAAAAAVAIGYADDPEHLATWDRILPGPAPAVKVSA